MKRITIIILSFIFITASLSPAIAKNGRNNKHYNTDNHYTRGYHYRPHDNRHYDNRYHRGRKHNYRGHWRSWNEWESYYRHHPEMHRHGNYFHDGPHLMFQFCDSGTDSCFFFSIGR